MSDTREQRIAVLEAELLATLDGGRLELSREQLVGGRLVNILKASMVMRPDATSSRQG